MLSCEQNINKIWTNQMQFEGIRELSKDRSIVVLPDGKSNAIVYPIYRKILKIRDPLLDPNT